MLILGGITLAVGLGVGAVFLFRSGDRPAAAASSAETAVAANSPPDDPAPTAANRPNSPQQPAAAARGNQETAADSSGQPLTRARKPAQPEARNDPAPGTTVAARSGPNPTPPTFTPRRSPPAAHQSGGTGENWPRFRGPGGAGHSPATGLPNTWSDSENLVWKTPLPGPGASSPVVWGSRVYVTCYSGYGLDVASPGNKSQLRRHLLCVDKSSGRILWNKTKPVSGEIAAYSSPHTIGKHGYATSTPAVDESGVYVFYGADGLIAYTHDGQPRWRANCGAKVHDYGSASSPVLYGNLVVIHAGVQCGALLAFDSRTGREAWRVKGLLPAYWTPLLVKANGRDELLYAGNYDYHVGAVDPRTGTKLWNCKLKTGTINGSPVADGDVVFLAGKNGKSAALRAGGSGNVSASHVVWEAGKGAYITSPVYHDGHVYLSRDGGVAYCLDAKSGRIVYEKRIDGYVYASPIVADGKLYYVTRTRGVLVLPARPEFRVLSHNTIKSDTSVFNGSPAVSGNRLFLRSDRFLYCLGASQ